MSNKNNNFWRVKDITVNGKSNPDIWLLNRIIDSPKFTQILASMSPLIHRNPLNSLNSFPRQVRSSVVQFSTSTSASFGSLSSLSSKRLSQSQDQDQERRNRKFKECSCSSCSFGGKRTYTTVNTSKWWSPDLNLFQSKKQNHLYGDGPFAHRKRLQKGTVFPTALNDKSIIPSHIMRPSYAMLSDGRPPPTTNALHLIKDKEDVQQLRNAGKLARRMLDLACTLAKNNIGITPHQIDTIVHRQIIQEGAYPSPLNYAGFPKSICASVNDVVLHGIPDDRPLEEGDLVKFDVSLYLKGFHGDNCGLVYLAPDSLEFENISTRDTVLQNGDNKSNSNNSEDNENLAKEEDSIVTKKKRHVNKDLLPAARATPSVL